MLVLSPFRLGEQPNIRVGVAMITSAPEALALHERLVDEVWRRALKGPAATAYLNRLLKSASDVAHRDNRKTPARHKTRRSRK
jgi:hypothetical protein